jgi:hypothetical protein
MISGANIPEIDALINADDTIGRLIQELSGFHKDHALAGKAAKAALHLTLARFILTDYGTGLNLTVSQE